jgi:bifunctional non-homologous end joining protein LigD
MPNSGKASSHSGLASIDVKIVGKDLFQLAKEKGLEGIIAKRKASRYKAGRRSPDWLKIKSRLQQEFVVCGFTEGKG